MAEKTIDELRITLDEFELSLNKRKEAAHIIKTDLNKLFNDEVGKVFTKDMAEKLMLYFNVDPEEVHEDEYVRRCDSVGNNYVGVNVFEVLHNESDYRVFLRNEIEEKEIQAKCLHAHCRQLPNDDGVYCPDCNMRIENKKK